ncbi:MAG TPA: AIPR family protein [Ferruginibacter sp.]|jgi:hypothetical protein|nr:AIPR family protein [Ferruginibacter sp.]
MNTSTAPKRKPFPFSFHTLRNISSPEDILNNRKIYVGHAPVSSILDLPTNANVRAYLVEAEGKLRKSYTSVHKAIRETLTENPENFSILNSGIVIVARNIEINEKEKVLELFNPSIINGSQTQGVLNDLKKAGRLSDSEIHIKFEIIITEDEDLIAETSIARNYQNDVMSISIAGRRKQFDELEFAFNKVIPDVKLRKSESEFPNDDTIDTEKLLQVITALIPTELWYRAGENDNPNKVYTYSMKARCLKEFQDVYKIAHDPTDENYTKYKELYNFYLDIAPEAWLLYAKWKSHSGFSGTSLRNGFIRDNSNVIVEIADGIIFPIISSLSMFAKKTKRGWKISPPDFFDEAELIQTAKTAMIEIAAHNPQTMGKSKACYSALLQITSIYKKLLNLKSE